MIKCVLRPPKRKTIIKIKIPRDYTDSVEYISVMPCICFNFLFGIVEGANVHTQALLCLDYFYLHLVCVMYATSYTSVYCITVGYSSFFNAVQKVRQPNIHFQ
jgi:hypothetical protein